MTNIIISPPANTLYQHPEWDEYKYSSGKDAIQKVMWFSLLNGCIGELSHFFDYMMWVLDARFGASHTFEISVADWPVEDEYYDPSFAFNVMIARDGKEIGVGIDAMSGCESRLNWQFGCWDHGIEDIEWADVIDLSTRSGFHQAVGLLEKFIRKLLNDQTR